MIDDEALIRIADRILADLEDRRDVKRAFQALKYDDPPIYREIQLAIGKLAYEGVVAEIDWGSDDE